jgi:hypothetical protein
MNAKQALRRMSLGGRWGVLGRCTAFAREVEMAAVRQSGRIEQGEFRISFNE